MCKCSTHTQKPQVSLGDWLVGLLSLKKKKGNKGGNKNTDTHTSLAWSTWFYHQLTFLGNLEVVALWPQRCASARAMFDGRRRNVQSCRYFGAEHIRVVSGGGGPPCRPPVAVDGGAGLRARYGTWVGRHLCIIRIGRRVQRRCLQKNLSAPQPAAIWTLSVLMYLGHIWRNSVYLSRCYLVASLASRFHLFVCNRGRLPGLKRKLLDTFLDSSPALVGEESHYGIQGSSAVDDCVGSRLHHGLFGFNPCSAVRGVSRIAQMYYRPYCVLEVAFLERDVTPMFIRNFLDPWVSVRIEHLNGCVLIVSVEPSHGLATSGCFLNCPFFFRECAIHRCLRTGWIASSLMYQVSTRNWLLFSFLVDAWVITFTSHMPFNKVSVTLRWRDVSVWNSRQSPISHIWRPHLTLPHIAGGSWRSWQQILIAFRCTLGSRLQPWLLTGVFYRKVAEHVLRLETGSTSVDTRNCNYVSGNWDRLWGHDDPWSWLEEDSECRLGSFSCWGSC